MKSEMGSWIIVVVLNCRLLGCASVLLCICPIEWVLVCGVYCGGILGIVSPVVSKKSSAAIKVVKSSRAYCARPCYSAMGAMELSLLLGLFLELGLLLRCLRAAARRRSFSLTMPRTNSRCMARRSRSISRISASVMM